jgi:hypothetical protein
MRLRLPEQPYHGKQQSAPSINLWAEPYSASEKIFKKSIDTKS